MFGNLIIIKLLSLNWIAEDLFCLRKIQILFLSQPLCRIFEMGIPLFIGFKVEFNFSYKKCVAIVCICQKRKMTKMQEHKKMFCISMDFNLIRIAKRNNIIRSNVVCLHLQFWRTWVWLPPRPYIFLSFYGKCLLVVLSCVIFKKHGLYISTHYCSCKMNEGKW